MANLSLLLRSIPQRFESQAGLIKRIIFSIVVLATASGAGILLPQRYQIILLSLIVGVFGLVFLYHQPQIGLVVLVGASLVIPFSLGTGTGTDLNVAILLVLALSVGWVLELFFKRSFYKFYFSRPVKPLILFLIVVIIAFGFGQIHWFPGVSPAPIRAQLGASILFFLSAMAFLLTSNQLDDLRWLKAMVIVFLGSGSVYLFLRLFPISNITEVLFPNGAAGSIFWVWMVVIAFSQAVFNQTLGSRWRLALGLLVACTLFIGIIQNRGWTSGWLPPLVGLVVATWFGLPRYWKFYAVILGGCVLFALPTILSFIMVGDNAYSVVTRFEAWSILGEIIKVNPFFGVGPANYYWYTRLFPIMGYFSLSFNSHNNYVDLIAQTGFLGLGVFLWFVFEIGRVILSLNSRVSNGFERAYIIGGLGGLAGTIISGMFGDWVIPFVYNIGYAGFRSSVMAWLFLGGIIAIEKNLVNTSKNK